MKVIALEYPMLYRRRYIPNEKVCLKNDTILYYDEEILLTEWRTIRPRADFDHGVSCCFLKNGVKISKFFKGDHLVYHYIDIIETHISHDPHEIILNDLLIDVIVENDGTVKVTDLDQIPCAFEQGLITSEQAMSAMRTTAWLLDIIYKGGFDELLKAFDITDKRCHTLYFQE